MDLPTGSVQNMDESTRAPTVFSSSTVDHPVDRTGLQDLEARVGTVNAYASCLLGEGAFAVVGDQGDKAGDFMVVIQQAVGPEWVAVSRHELWTDAYRALGELIDDAIDRVPIDPIDRPSPTILIAGDNGCVEVLYRTVDGVRVAREFDEGFDPRFEVYAPLWEDFITATDDEATDTELSG